MRKRLRFLVSLVVGPGVILPLIAVAGCSNESVVTAPKAAVESKRDELQRKTQSGVPGKPG